MVLTRGVTYLL